VARRVWVTVENNEGQDKNALIFSKGDLRRFRAGELGLGEFGGGRKTGKKKGTMRLSAFNFTGKTVSSDHRNIKREGTQEGQGEWKRKLASARHHLAKNS